MKIVAILQARMGSTRLPGKMLLPLLDKPLVQHVIERVQRATRLDAVVLAFPSKDIDVFIPFASLVHLYGYPLDEADLVGRYLGAAQAYDADIIARIPCDNPCVDPKYIDEAVGTYLGGCYTFYSNTTELAPQPSALNYLDGVGCEVFSLSRLRWLDQITVGNPTYREHPHRWFYDQSTCEEYDCISDGIAISGRCMPTTQLDVNDKKDYDFIAKIYAHFGHNRFTTEDVVSYLTTKEASHESIQREQPSGSSQQRA